MLAFLRISVIIEKNSAIKRKVTQKMQNIDEFIEDLLDKKGISIDNPEIRAGIVSDMKEKLEKQIDQACIESLSEENAKELASLIDQPDFNNDKMTEFMLNSGVDMEKIALETMEKFRDLYLNGEEQNV